MSDFKKSLVGAVSMPGHAEFEDIKKIETSKPLSSSESICSCVCTQCQNIFEVNEEFVIGLYRTMDILGSAPEISVQNLKNSKKYFEVNYCNLCKKQDEVKIQLKDI